MIAYGFHKNSFLGSQKDFVLSVSKRRQSVLLFKKENMIKMKVFAGAVWF